MSDPPLPPEPHEAELVGLPQRSDSRGRDKLEEIASRYLDAVRAGEEPDIEVWAAREPKLAAELREFLPLVAAMEDWKAHQDVKAARNAWTKEFQVRQLGDCRIVREVARGGMGVVFEAEQGELGRRVAVKLLPWKFARNSSRAEQFLREARIAAGLQHANIVPIFSFGQQEENSFYVMQLIEGAGLDKLIERWRRDNGLVFIEDLIAEVHPGLSSRAGDLKQTRRFLRKDSWGQLAKIAAQIASALRYAHQQGTLHRDVKPANLLIDRQGKVWITDFGLAIAEEHFLDDRPETVAGTVRYMAPERFLKQGDARSDIYSFGATLYELCTLQPAFAELDRRKMLTQIERGEFPRPRAITRALPRALEMIILRAMALLPEQRYQSADELQADLLRFLNTPALGTRSGWRRFFGR